MKIFNRENDEDKVYVQKEDLAMLSSVDKTMPKSIKEYINKEPINEYNGKEFVEFTDPNELRFFASKAWIIDYDKYIGAGDYYLEKVREEFIAKKDTLLEKYNSLTDKDEKQKKDVSIEHNLMTYKIRGLDEILKMREGNSEVKVPLVPNGYKSAFAGNDSIPYEMRQAIDPNLILLYRKDGKPLSMNEQIPLNFLQMGMSIAMLDRESNGFVAGDYEVTRRMSPDNKYFITEYKLQKYIEDEQVKEKSKKEEKGIRKVLTKLFKRRDK